MNTLTSREEISVFLYNTPSMTTKGKTTFKNWYNGVFFVGGGVAITLLTQLNLEYTKRKKALLLVSLYE